MDLLWELCKDDVLISRNEFEQKFEGWIVDPHPKGVRVSKGAEFHFVLKPDQQITRADIRWCVAPIIEQFGYAETTTPTHDVRQHRFNKILGFREVARDADFVRFRIERMKHV